MFNKDGRLIAAQWTAASGAWLEIGEVTGSGDGGLVHGVAYDHVLPVEMDVPGSGVQTLQLGYNNMESPFDAAQRFIDQNSLGQHYLRQIADWITARTGTSAPTLDMSRSSSSASSAARPTKSANIQRSFAHFPQKVNLNQDEIIAGFQSKITPKIIEFNASMEQEALRLNANEMEAVNALVTVLTQTSYYHSSQTSPIQLSCVIKMSQWPVAQCFPAFDLARLIAVHPNGARTLAIHPQSVALFQNALRVVSLPAGDVPSAALLCSLRFLSNSLKFDELRARFFSMLSIGELVESCRSHVRSSNKQIRLAVATLALNISYAAYRTSSASASATSSPCALAFDDAQAMIRILIDLLVGEGESSEVVHRAVVAVGTLAVLGGATMANRLVAAGFQTAPIQLLLQRWTGRLNTGTIECVAEALAAVSV